MVTYMSPAGGGVYWLPGVVVRHVQSHVLVYQELCHLHVTIDRRDVELGTYRIQCVRNIGMSEISG